MPRSDCSAHPSPPQTSLCSEVASVTPALPTGWASFLHLPPHRTWGATPRLCVWILNYRALVQDNLFPPWRLLEEKVFRFSPKQERIWESEWIHHSLILKFYYYSWFFLQLWIILRRLLLCFPPSREFNPEVCVELCFPGVIRILKRKVPLKR